MGRYVIVRNNANKIEVLEKLSNKMVAYIQFNDIEIAGQGYIEIEQVMVSKDHRGSGLGTKLLLDLFHDAVVREKGIHLQIQPGSSAFYKKFFMDQFHVKKFGLFKCATSTLARGISDGKVLNLPHQQIIKCYKFPYDERNVHKKLQRQIQNRQRLDPRFHP